MTLLRGKALAELYFTRLEGKSSHWKCRCGQTVKQSSTGYTNLCNHVLNAHPESLTMTTDMKGQSLINHHFYPPRVLAMYVWLDMIIKGLLPFSFVEKEYVFRNMKVGKVSLGSFMLYFSKLYQGVVHKATAKLPEEFALVFDGWSAGNRVHYMGIFATFPSSLTGTYTKVLLSFAPVGSGESLTAEAHYDHTGNVLSLFKKSWGNVLCLIGDNCSTNRKLARLAKRPFIGCASHRFNLAVKKIVEKDKMIIDKVNRLMKKLKTTIPSARLRCATHLVPKTTNVTRWSSTRDMVTRYLEIRGHIRGLNLNDVDSLCLLGNEEREVEQLAKKLDDLNAVSMVLQQEDVTMSRVRSLFDVVVSDYCVAKEHLSPTAEVVECPAFESAVVKMQREKELSMTPDEARSVECLRVVEAVAEVEARESGASLVERATKKLRVETVGSRTGYMDTSFLVPTSNMCERLFSKAGYALADRRHSMLPGNFEAQLVLNANDDLWGIEDVKELMRTDTESG